MPATSRSTAAIDSMELPLFVPADRTDRLAKAARSGADALIVDLEDAVLPAGKSAARAGLATALAGLAGVVPVLLRINASGTDWHAGDLAAALHLPLAGIMLPKTETAADVVRVAEASRLPVVALVESAAAMPRLEAIAAAAARLAFGSIDYAADLGMAHSRPALAHARAQIVLASRLAGRPAPIDGVTAALHGHVQLADDCAHAREMGFGGKLVIHPAQLAPARAAFRPSDKEVDWARRVLQAAGNAGAVTVDGAMVDAPVILRARQVLARVAQAGAAAAA